MSGSGLFSPWRVQLFDGPLARQGDVTISRFRSQKIAALFAYLCLFRTRRHTREELADMLWPDETVEVGRANLRTALAILRRQLEPEGVPNGAVLVTEGQTYLRINTDGVIVDVAEFESALTEGDTARAVSLYAGPLLPGISADWAVAERERLDEAFRAAKARSTASGATAHAVSPVVENTPSPAPPPRRRLPATLTRFFGRESELSTIKDLLAGQVRLVTLTGTGGSGKTRLAIEAARQLIEDFTGVFFVPLADVREGGRLADAIAEGTDIVPNPTVAPIDALIAALNATGDSVLLVLDNTEHLTESLASLIQTLLGAVPGLSLLVTSRQRLLVEGEREIALSPLPVPELPGTPERLLEFPSVQLFVSRAQTNRPDFQLTARNAESVVALCRRLEGIPLAIELAAGWAQTLTVAQMLERLENRFELLVSRRRDISPRHATLRAAIESSVRLLPEEVQQFFTRLSVFEGGWTAEAAEAVTDDWGAMEHLALLRDHSLVVTEPGPDEEIRFRMLETLREYAKEQVTEELGGELARKHAEYFLEFARATLPHLKQANQKVHLDRLEADHPNFRAALAWCRRTDGAEDAGLRLVQALFRFYAVRGHFREGVEVARGILAHRPEHQDPTCRADALNTIGMMARHLDEYDLARASMEECLALWRQLGKDWGVSSALANLGTIAMTASDYDTAKIYLVEALDLCRRLNREHATAICLNNLAIIARRSDDPMTARLYQEESLHIMRSIQDVTGIALNLYNLSLIYNETGETGMARAYAQESLRLNVELNNPEGIAGCLILIALIAGRDAARAERDAHFLGASEVLRENHSLPVSHSELVEYNIGIADIRALLGEERFKAAWETGRTLPRDEAIRRALAETGVAEVLSVKC
jgi:predicted ATPase